jgi:Ca2+-binding EF-hand superfamily protein
MISLFREFDKDGSNSLEKAELYGLFQKYGIAVSREELEHFFALVDRNHDSSLTLDEFKVCLQDPTANAYFREIM